MPTGRHARGDGCPLDGGRWLPTGATGVAAAIGGTSDSRSRGGSSGTSRPRRHGPAVLGGGAASTGVAGGSCSSLGHSSAGRGDRLASGGMLGEVVDERGCATVGVVTLRELVLGLRRERLVAGRGALLPFVGVAAAAVRLVNPARANARVQLAAVHATRADHGARRDRRPALGAEGGGCCRSVTGRAADLPGLGGRHRRPLCLSRRRRARCAAA